MPNYKRAVFEGGYYFFTLVTYHKYVKEGIYGQLNDFETINNIDTEYFGE
jgi:hypothetical protein